MTEFTYFEFVLITLGMIGAACFIHEKYEPKMDEAQLKQYLKRVTNRDRSKKDNVIRGIQWHTKFWEARQ